MDSKQFEEIKARYWAAAYVVPIAGQGEIVIPCEPEKIGPVKEFLTHCRRDILVLAMEHERLKAEVVRLQIEVERLRGQDLKCPDCEGLLRRDTDHPWQPLLCPKCGRDIKSEDAEFWAGLDRKEGS